MKDGEFVNVNFWTFNYIKKIYKLCTWLFIYKSNGIVSFETNAYEG